MFDVKKQYKIQYSMSKKIHLVTVPEFRFIMIEGLGNPRVTEFNDKSLLLRTISRQIKKMYPDITYVQPPLEGVWDTYDNDHFDVVRKNDIKYSLMMQVPADFNEEMLEEIKALMPDMKYIDDVVVRNFREGLSLQLLYKGPYEQEINATKEIMEYITVSGLKLSGYHHEIYLNDPNKVLKDNLKTIIRYPVEEER